MLCRFIAKFIYKIEFMAIILICISFILKVYLFESQCLRVRDPVSINSFLSFPHWPALRQDDARIRVILVGLTHGLQSLTHYGDHPRLF